LRWNPAFAPQGANANFAQILAPGNLVLRTFERGVEGETLACGTGVCASAIVAHLVHFTHAPVKVRVQGGDTLEVDFKVHGNDVRDVTLKGPADFVFEGTLEL